MVRDRLRQEPFAAPLGPPQAGISPPRTFGDPPGTGIPIRQPLRGDRKLRERNRERKVDRSASRSGLMGHAADNEATWRKVT